MILVRDILDWLDDYAPFHYAAKWDQCGLQVGDPDGQVDRILVALDPLSASLREAEECGCQCVVTHHPLIFHPLKSVRGDEYPGSLVLRAVRSGLHVIAAHTNLDAAREGTNEHLARLFSLSAVEPLEIDPLFRGEPLYGGMGRIGSLPAPTTLEELVAKAANVLGHSGLRVVGDPGGPVHRVALCTGSGGSLVEQAVKAGCQAFITGDVKYHDARYAIEAGLAVIDVGHFASERLILEPLAAFLRSTAEKRRASVRVLVAMSERDPFWIPEAQRK